MVSYANAGMCAIGCSGVAIVTVGCDNGNVTGFVCPPVRWHCSSVVCPMMQQRAVVVTVQ